MHKKYLSSVVLVVCLPISLQHCAPDLSVMQEEPSQVERQSLTQVAGNLPRHSLEMAIVLEVPEVLKVLLEEVPEHMYQEPDEEDGSTLLHFAACAGATSCVQLLVEEKHLSVVAQDHEGGLPLHYAATKGNVECMLYLIEQMQSIGRQDLLNATGGKFGFTPLHCLVASEEVEDDEANLERVVSVLASNKSLKDCRERTPRDLVRSMSEVAIDPDLL
ncbi:MAG: ankyrin repeat domain-containing protein [Bacteroidota bacterium]